MGGSFGGVRYVDTHVLGVRCVVYVEALGEIIDSRQACYGAAVPAAAEVDNKKTPPVKGLGATDIKTA